MANTSTEDLSNKNPSKPVIRTMEEDLRLLKNNPSLKMPAAVKPDKIAQNMPINPASAAGILTASNAQAEKEKIEKIRKEKEKAEQLKREAAEKERVERIRLNKEKEKLAQAEKEKEIEALKKKEENFRKEKEKAEQLKREAAEKERADQERIRKEKEKNIQAEKESEKKRTKSAGKAKEKHIQIDIDKEKEEFDWLKKNAEIAEQERIRKEKEKAAEWEREKEAEILRKKQEDAKREKEKADQAKREKEKIEQLKREAIEKERAEQERIKKEKERIEQAEREKKERAEREKEAEARRKMSEEIKKEMEEEIRREKEKAEQVKLELEMEIKREKERMEEIKREREMKMKKRVAEEIKKEMEEEIEKEKQKVEEIKKEFETEIKKEMEDDSKKEKEMEEAIKKEMGVVMRQEIINQIKGEKKPEIKEKTAESAVQKEKTAEASVKTDSHIRRFGSVPPLNLPLDTSAGDAKPPSADSLKKIAGFDQAKSGAQAEAVRILEENFRQAAEQKIGAAEKNIIPEKEKIPVKKDLAQGGGIAEKTEDIFAYKSAWQDSSLKSKFFDNEHSDMPKEAPPSAPPASREPVGGFVSGSASAPDSVSSPKNETFIPPLSSEKNISAPAAQNKFKKPFDFSPKKKLSSFSSAQTIEPAAEQKKSARNQYRELSNQYEHISPEMRLARQGFSSLGADLEEGMRKDAEIMDNNLVLKKKLAVPAEMPASAPLKKDQAARQVLMEYNAAGRKSSSFFITIIKIIIIVMLAAGAAYGAYYFILKKTPETGVVPADQFLPVFGSLKQIEISADFNTNAVPAIQDYLKKNNTLATAGVSRIIIKDTAEGRTLKISDFGKVLGIAMPSKFSDNLSGNYDLIVFNYPQNNYLRMGLVLKVKNAELAEASAKEWEPSMFAGLKSLLVDASGFYDNSKSFGANNYKNISIKYLSLGKDDLALNYAVNKNKNIFFFATSKTDMYYLADLSEK